MNSSSFATISVAAFLAVLTCMLGLDLGVLKPTPERIALIAVLVLIWLASFYGLVASIAAQRR